jgi:chromosome segregation ATPase
MSLHIAGLQAKVIEKRTKVDERRKQVATLQDQLNTATTEVHNQRSSTNGLAKKIDKLQADSDFPEEERNSYPAQRYHVNQSHDRIEYR